MIRFIFVFSIITSSALNTVGQSSIEKWESLLDKPDIAAYFSGIFNKMGFVVLESGEQFTVTHQGDHFSIEEGIIEDSVDYVINLKMENVDNMLKHGSDERIDEYESFRIMSVLFTPLTEASLTNPMLTRNVMRIMSGVENHIHVNLVAPDAKDTVSHTLIYLNKEWTVVPGIHGNAKRVFNLTQQDAIDYQRKVFEALQTNTMKDWKKFRKWYMEWRPAVSRAVNH